MKKVVLIFTLLFSLISVSAFAESPFQQREIRKAGNTGIGFGTGTFASGFSLKTFLSDDAALQFNLGYWRGCWGCDYYYYNNHGIAISGDFLIEGGSFMRAANDVFSIDWSFGFGGGLGFNQWDNNDDIAIAGSGIFGVEFNLHLLPVDFVIEYRPSLVVVPEVGLDIFNLTGHVRYYF